MERLAETGTMLRDRAGLLRGQVEDAVQESRDRLELRVHQHPLQTILVSVGIGLVVGLVLGILGRRERE